MVIVVADVGTTYYAHTRLALERVPRAVVGHVSRLTLAHNPGVAFGLSLGLYSRWLFTAPTVVVVVLCRFILQRAPTARGRLFALGLVTAGPVGNLIDRA